MSADRRDTSCHSDRRAVAAQAKGQASTTSHSPTSTSGFQPDRAATRLRSPPTGSGSRAARNSPPRLPSGYMPCGANARGGEAPTTMSARSTYGNGCGSGLSGRYLNIFQNKAPTLRCRPDLVHGMPVARDTRRFALVMPNWRFQLHPPLFISDTPFRMDRRAGRNGAHQRSPRARPSRIVRLDACLSQRPIVNRHLGDPTIEWCIDDCPCVVIGTDREQAIG